MWKCGSLALGWCWLLYMCSYVLCCVRYEVYCLLLSEVLVGRIYGVDQHSATQTLCLCYTIILHKQSCLVFAYTKLIRVAYFWSICFADTIPWPYHVKWCFQFWAVWIGLLWLMLDNSNRLKDRANDLLWGISYLLGTDQWYCSYKIFSAVDKQPTCCYNPLKTVKELGIIRLRD